MVIKKDLIVFLTIFIIGFILASLSTVSYPIASYTSIIWPASALQAIGGVLFGIYGVIACVLFPSASNMLTIGSISHVLWIIPANIIQGGMPFVVKKITKFKPYQFGKKTILCFVIGCAILPNILGAIVGSTMFYLSGNIKTLDVFWTTVKVWIVGNIPCAIIFGLLLLRTLAPVLKDCDLYYSGYFK